MTDREWYKSHRICPMCRVNDAFGNFVHCAECLEKISLNNVKYRSNPEKNREYEQRAAAVKKQKRDAWKAAGICIRCGKAKAVKGVLCVECYVKQRRQREKEKTGRKRPGEHFRERVAAGVCMYCCKPVVEGYCFCEAHLPERIACGKRTGQLYSETMRREIHAGWELAMAIHAKKEERKKHD